MKIGIFECDYMPDNLQSDFISYPEMLIRSFDENNCNFEYKVYESTYNQFPKDINECDAYITTGSLHSINDGFLWITKLEEFVRQCQKKKKTLVGICFGHQLLAKALGGEVKKNELGLGLGVIENHIMKQEPWMVPNQTRLNMIISHEDQIVKMPDGARLLASNSHCRNFMLQIDDNFLGIQGHPEFNNDFICDLIKVREDIIPYDKVKTAYESFSKTPDNSLVIQWIINFLNTNDCNKNC